MTTSRRDFIRSSMGVSLAAGAGLGGLAASAAGASLHRRAAPKSLLILGGTNFIGPHIIDAAKAAGYSVTIFNRGITEERKQTPIEGVEKITGDRDPDKGDGLKNLEARIKEKGGWDAVIDTSGFYPRIVKAFAELLAPAVKQYVFISSLSVYADNSKPGMDESAPVGTMEDPTVEDMGPGYANYGPLKALCEQAAEAALPGRAANIRCGFIVGPGDGSDRFTYWPVRFDKGGEVLVPGTPEDPVQFIDVRDLAKWLVHVVEMRTMGVFNATGPAGGCTVGRLVKACQAAASTPSTPVYVDAEFLESQGVGGGVVTILIPTSGEASGFHQRSIAKAVAAGYTSRPVEVTVKDTLAWWPGEVERRVRVTRDILADAEEENAKLRAEGKEEKPLPQMADPEKLRAGLDPEREAAILTAYRERAAASPDGAESGSDAGNDKK